MASRNFCDLCNTEIGQDVVYFSIEGDHVNDNDYPDPILLKNGRVQPAVLHTMVCLTCYVTIRNAIDSQKRKGAS